MNQHKPGRRGRFTAAIAAFGIAALGAIGVGTAASADVSELDFGNIDSTQQRTITIHKHETQTGTDVEASPDGSIDIPSDGVAGVQFTAYPILDADGVQVDLTIPENWDFLQGLTVSTDGTLSGGPATADPAGEYSPGPWTRASSGIVSTTTGTDGLATITGGDLSIGAYVVIETQAPPAVVQQALPFIVTVPFPHENGWLYNVHVYPKNGLTAIEKTIEAQEGLGLGSTVSFPVTTDIPGLEAGIEFTSYVVQDTLDPRLGNLAVASVQVGGVDVPAAHYDVVITGQTVRVEFKVDDAAAQAWLLSQGGNQLVTTFQGTVESLTAPGTEPGIITNQATVFVNDPEEDNGIDSGEVRTNWGDLLIQKTDSSDPGATLDGAIFEVYAVADPYATSAPADAESSAVGQPISVNGQTTFESVNGIVTIPGLFVSDSENPSVNATERWYIIKEIQAPAGFITPTGDAAYRAVQVSAGETAAHDVSVENTQQEVPDLPLTGAAGQILMIAGGIALVLIAAGVLVVRNRRASNQ